MIDLATKSENYAADKTNEVLTKAIAKAYADGYRDGYKERDEELSVDLRDNNTKFVDLGLPSGTLWAADYETESGKILYASHKDVAEFSLPTEEQVKELFDKCIWKLYNGIRDKYCYLCIGPNENYITFDFSGYKNPSPLNNVEERYWNAHFWVKTDKDHFENKAVNISLEHDSLERRIVEKKLKKISVAYMMPIRLVKNK